MALDLHFVRSDSSTSWGFRLAGGVDFGAPLVVIKVNENSLAESSGLQVDDIIVRINDTCTAGLTLLEVHDLLHKAGNDFTLGIRRGEVGNALENQDVEINEEVTAILQSSESVKSLEDITMTVDKTKIQEHAEQKQLIEERNDVRSTSLNSVSNDNNLYGKEELGVQNKKWSTFLQKPNKPIPVRMKEDDKAQTSARAAPYKVVITKQKKSNTPYKKHVEFKEEVIESVTEIQNDDQCSLEIEVKVKETEETSIEVEEKSETSSILEECNVVNEGEEEEDESRTFVSEIKSERTPSLSDIKIDDIESSLSLEEQLAQVQKQLQALSQLPSAIQVTLDAVSKQLAKIVGAKEENNESPRRSSIVLSEETSQERNNKDVEVSDEDQKTEHDISESIEDNNIEDLHDEETQSLIANEELSLLMSNEDDASKDENNNEPNLGQTDEEIATKLEEEARLAKKQKAMEEGASESQRLRPIQRPIILPGGRKWSDPEDAVAKPRESKMTDEKIASTLESYFEVIEGKTKGINFLKYQPPPKNLDHLQRSEVYRLVHDMEPPVRGISTRAEKILSEQDYYERSSSEFS